MISIAVLMTCYNRVSSTVKCLNSLFSQCGIGIIYTLDVFLVDDSSSDGTSSIIQSEFPSVNLIQGSGNLYWNRGMHLAWKTASNNVNYDYFLWLNDDAFLYNNAITCLLKTSKSFENMSIICGSTFSKKLNSISYGGYDVNGKVLFPNGFVQECYCFNGNILLVPKYVCEKVGILDPRFIHAIGDFEYAMRIRKFNLKSYVAPSYLGICEDSDKLPIWCQSDYSLIKRIKNLYSPLGNSHPYYFFLFNRLYNGYYVAFKHLISTHVRLLFPNLWRKK